MNSRMGSIGTLKRGLRIVVVSTVVLWHSSLNAKDFEISFRIGPDVSKLPLPVFFDVGDDYVDHTAKALLIEELSIDQNVIEPKKVIANTEVVKWEKKRMSGWGMYVLYVETDPEVNLPNLFFCDLDHSYADEYVIQNDFRKLVVKYAKRNSKGQIQHRYTVVILREERGRANVENEH